MKLTIEIDISAIDKLLAAEAEYDALEAELTELLALEADQARANKRGERIAAILPKFARVAALQPDSETDMALLRGAVQGIATGLMSERTIPRYQSIAERAQALHAAVLPRTRAYSGIAQQNAEIGLRDRYGDVAQFLQDIRAKIAKELDKALNGTTRP